MKTKKAIVYRSTGSWYLVKLEDSSFIKARLKGRFRKKNLKTTNPIAVGDIVDVNIKERDNVVIENIHKRNNYVIRKSVNLSKESHIIASNIDLCVLVSSLRNPVTATGFIDRFTVTSQAYGIPLLIVFNKIDIYSDDDKKILDKLISTYTRASCLCLTTSAETNVGTSKLKEILKDKTTLFSGNSGAGKSSLINSIDNSLDLTTANISESHLKGRHTTTFAEMFDLKFGGKIIDSPGIKGMGFIDIEKNELANYFPEMFALLSKCKYNNCLHINEPNCAVKNAVDNKQISEFRYNNYLAMYNDEDNLSYRTDIYS
jgi:ribosome biogenesis GTPase / thiamine phosphate phosphatase